VKVPVESLVILPTDALLLAVTLNPSDTQFRTMPVLFLYIVDILTPFPESLSASLSPIP
jgi:hypothetical protein